MSDSIQDALDKVTRDYLRPELERLGVPNPEQYEIAYDMTPLDGGSLNDKLEAVVGMVTLAAGTTDDGNWQDDPAMQRAAWEGLARNPSIPITDRLALALQVIDSLNTGRDLDENHAGLTVDDDSICHTFNVHSTHVTIHRDEDGKHHITIRGAGPGWPAELTATLSPYLIAAAAMSTLDDGSGHKFELHLTGQIIPAADGNSWTMRVLGDGNPDD